MSLRRNIFVRLYERGDEPTLEHWRALYRHVELDAPHGYDGQHALTFVAEKDGQPICSLTGTIAVVLDPYLKDAKAAPLDLVTALQQMEDRLLGHAATCGASDSFIAVPPEEADYIRLLERCGYEHTAEACVLMRRHLVKPVNEKVLEEAT